MIFLLLNWQATPHWTIENTAELSWKVGTHGLIP